MRKSVCLAIALLVIMSVGARADTKPPMQPMMKQQVPPAVMQKMATDPMLAAQRWLKSIGYNLTMDQMKTLKRLVLQKYSLDITPRINDDTMKHVKVLTGLEIIQIPRQITDKGIRNLSGLSNLRVVNMPICGVTDVGMGYVAGLPRMNNLVVSGCNITDEGVRKVAGRHFAVLNLTRTKITDKAINHLKGHSIDKFFVSFTDVSDASVDTLISFRPSRLDIQGTRITPSGFRRLKAALPNSKIVYP